MKNYAIKKHAALFVFLFIFLSAAAFAQYSPQNNPQYGAQSNGAVLIPQIVYVGDPAVLVLTLPASIKNSDDVILTSLSQNIPKDDNIDFRRVILERRVTGSRLLIEFTAFVPGYLKLPDIEIGGEYFTGLSVIISSVIDARKPMQLSGYASSLAMPGTATVLYGIMAAVALFLVLLFWFIFKGRAFIKLWAEKWKRIRLFTFIRNMEKRLKKALLRGEDKRAVLNKLSDTFREFLSVLTNKNCHSMTSREFNNLPEELIQNGVFLGYFFRQCDRLRFSGEDINLQDISGLLDDLGGYIEKLYAQGGAA